MPHSELALRGRRLVSRAVRDLLHFDRSCAAVQRTCQVGRKLELETQQLDAAIQEKEDEFGLQARKIADERAELLAELGTKQEDVTLFKGLEEEAQNRWQVFMRARDGYTDRKDSLNEACKDFAEAEQRLQARLHEEQTVRARRSAVLQSKLLRRVMQDPFGMSKKGEAFSLPDSAYDELVSEQRAVADAQSELERIEGALLHLRARKQHAILHERFSEAEELAAELEQTGARDLPLSAEPSCT